MSDPKTTGQFAKGNPGKPKGAVNKVTNDLRSMVLAALDDAGGQLYLADRAVDSPQAFMALVGKCLPKEVNLTANVKLADLVRDARTRLAKRRDG